MDLFLFLICKKKLRLMERKYDCVFTIFTNLLTHTNLFYHVHENYQSNVHKNKISGVHMTSTFSNLKARYAGLIKVLVIKGMITVILRKFGFVLICVNIMERLN